jgi:hypothetical protein
MKKILVLTAVLVFAATNCFAVGSGATGAMTLTTDTGLTMYADATAATVNTAKIGKLSTGVGVGWITSDIGYALVTQHKSGTKAYGTSYDSTSMFQTIAEGTPGTVILANPTVIDTTSFATAAWKSM